MDTRVFDVTVLKSYVIFDLRSHYHYRTLVFRAIALLFFSLGLLNVMLRYLYVDQTRYPCDFL